MRALLEREKGDRPTRLYVRSGGRFVATIALDELPARPSQELVDGARALFGSAVTVTMR